MTFSRRLCLWARTGMYIEKTSLRHKTSSRRLKDHYYSMPDELGHPVDDNVPCGIYPVDTEAYSILGRLEDVFRTSMFIQLRSLKRLIS